MLQDCKQILWLLIRHARTGLTNIAYAAGTDIITDNNASDRLYQVYVLAIVIIAAFLSWFGSLDVIVGIIVALDTIYLDFFSALLFAGYGALFIAQCAEHQRTFPVKLSYPDTSFVAASPINMQVIALVAVLKTSLLWGLCGIVIGYTLGVIVCAGGVYATEAPLLFALISLLIFICLDVIASMLGSARLLVRPKRRNLFVLGVVLIAVVLVTSLLLLVGVFLPGLLTQAGLIGFLLANLYALIVALSLIIVIDIIAILLLSKRLSVAEIISENGLYAELFTLRHLQMANMNSYRELRRRKLLSMRTPVLNLPEKSGGLMVVRRSALSLVRQREGIGSLLVYALTIIPLGVYLLLGTFVLPLYFLWICLLVVLPGGQHELTRVFRDDCRNRMLRDHLPCGTLKLLILDSLPAFLMTSVVSVAVVAFLPLGSNLPLALLLAVFLNLAIVLCGGLASVVITKYMRRVSFELSIAALLVALGVAAVLFAPVFVVVGAAALTALYAALIKRGVEL